MTVCNFIILVCLWIAIGIIVYHLVKIRSMLFDIRTSQCKKPQYEISERTKYLPFFDIADYDKFKQCIKECLDEKNNIEFELKTIIGDSTNTELIVKDILDRYDIIPKSKDE